MESGKSREGNSVPCRIISHTHRFSPAPAYKFLQCDVEIEHAALTLTT